MPIDKDQIYESATEMLYTIISRINKQEIVYLSSATGQSALTGSPQEISGVREVEQIIHPFDPPALEAELNVAISAQRNLGLSAEYPLSAFSNVESWFRVIADEMTYQLLSAYEVEDISNVSSTPTRAYYLFDTGNGWINEPLDELSAWHTHDQRYYREDEVDLWRNGTTSAVMGYVSGVNSDIQVQLDDRYTKDETIAEIQQNDILTNIPFGATSAIAEPNGMWATSGHATLPDGVLMLRPNY